ncbi:MAG: hypothetical protein V7L20_13565 [Nostoc sp.]|uniref:DUF7453 family protein n=1 Tax=Nostoc sp. TaxID=1180 RepID=UPI002FFB8DDA
MDSKQIKDLRIGREGLSGNQIAFTANFTDGSEGIYIATLVPVSEPSSVSSILASGAFGAGFMLRAN